MKQCLSTDSNQGGYYEVKDDGDLPKEGFQIDDHGRESTGSVGNSASLIKKCLRYFDGIYLGCKNFAEVSRIHRKSALHVPTAYWDMSRNMCCQGGSKAEKR